VQFDPTTLRDAWLIRIDPIRDQRGFFARTFCVEEFASRALETKYPQHSISYTARKGSLRGMHYQREPHSEAKVVRCVSGAIWDVIIDIIRSSIGDEAGLARQGMEMVPELAQRNALSHRHAVAHDVQIRL
jgi:dTDP-4-dehydrorhamnose 3,5-epimerase